MDQKRREATDRLQTDNIGKAAGLPAGRESAVFEGEKWRFSAPPWIIAVQWTQTARFET
jgi:hypothetical protein